jgi:hypothetical protein
MPCLTKPYPSLFDWSFMSIQYVTYFRDENKFANKKVEPRESFDHMFGLPKNKNQ